MPATMPADDARVMTSTSRCATWESSWDSTASTSSALQKITDEIAVTPKRDLRASQAMNAFFIAPAISGLSWNSITATHPSLEQRLEQLAKVSAELGRPFDGGFSGGPEGPLGPLGR